MPCISEGCGEDLNTQNLVKARHKAAWLEAALCAVLSSVTRLGQIDAVMSGIDEAEAGVKAKRIQDWLVHHRKQDELRRAREKREAEQANRVKEASTLLDSFTDEQRAALIEALRRRK